nr:PKD domain-containing protein [Bacteroidota bacterium]
MKNFLLCFALTMSLTALTATEGYEVNFTSINPTTAEITFVINDFDLRSIILDGKSFTKILFEGNVHTQEKGFAEVPLIHANIQIPALNNVHLKITHESYTDYQLEFPLVPSRGVIYRDQDPSVIPYEIAPESIVDAYYPNDLSNITDPYIIKDVRGMTVYLYPFRYNAVTGTLRVYHQVEIRLTQSDDNPVNPIHSTSGKYFPEMEELYQSVFINYESSLDDLSVPEAGDILVITTTRDETAIQPYIDWKMEKGFDVFKEVVATGTNVKSLIQQRYNENNDILYVQLVGDWADIKCDLGGGASAPTDPMLGCVAGSDNFPDIAIGRFSASSASHVTIQVNKVISYEKNPSGNWYADAIGVASNQGPGDDSEYDNAHLDVIWNNKLDPFTYDNYSYAYDPSATSTMVKNYIEAGAGVINYCGHGSSTSWGSSGFSNSNIATLTNGNMLPYIFSVACVNGAFHSTECFAEAWLKKEGGGAVMTLMSTINQPWDPPMRGQDYFNDLLTGGYNYTTNPGNGINTDEGRTIIGSIVVNGFVLMYTESNSSSDLNTMATWTTFGDPSMQVRTATPSNLTLSNTTLLTGSPFGTTISMNGAPLENAMICLSQEGLFQSAYTDASGSVTIPNEFTPGDVMLVVTGFNASTIYQTIECIPMSGPYIVFNTAEVNDASGNNNGQLDYGETAGLDVALENVGTGSATDVVVTLSTTDLFITITDNVENYGTFGPGEIIQISYAFGIEVSDNVPDGHVIQFNLSAVSDETWESSFTLTAHAGVLEYGDYSIDDAGGNNNGILDPGETASLVVTIQNTGSSDATQVFGELTTTGPYLTISQTQMPYGTIGANDSGVASFIVSADASTPAGHVVDFNFDITADKGLTANGSFMAVVGQIPIVIIDLDGNNNSANKIAEALDAAGMPYDESQTFPEDLNLYSNIFICLGIYANNHVLSTTEGSALADFLNAGGNLYMEGGDTWYYDPATAVHPMFAIDGISDGSGDMSAISGQTGTFTEGMIFSYSGDNNWMDHIGPTGNAVTIFRNQQPDYGCGVAYDAGSYKTIGTSFEFGGLSDSDATKQDLMQKYLEFFGLTQPITANFSANPLEVLVGESVQFTDLSIGNIITWEWDFNNDGTIDSFQQNPSWTYIQAGIYSVKLTVFGADLNPVSILKKNLITVNNPDNHFNPVWTTPFNPMTFYVLQATIDGSDMDPGDEVGLFDMDPVTSEKICVGAGTLVETLTGGNYLEIVASMDDGSNPSQANGFTPGNEISYKLFSQASGEYENILANYPYPGYDEVYTSQGSTFVELNAILTMTQSIPLQSGWNLMSFCVDPDNQDMLDIVQPLIDEDVLFKVLDETGGSIFHLPFPPPNGQWSNTIGDMLDTEGYYIKLTGDATLTLDGYLVTMPMDIPLSEGWNIISYPCQNPRDAMEAVQSLIDEDVLYKVIDEAGGVIFHLPFPPPNGQWTNSIGNFENGKGYYIKVTDEAVLNLTEPIDGASLASPIKPKAWPIHFHPAWDNNPFMPMHLMLMPDADMATGDEVAVFDGEICVGVTVYDGNSENPISMTASLDDPQTTIVDGYTAGNEFSIKIWQHENQVQIDDAKVDYISGTWQFQPLETFVGIIHPLLTSIEALTAQSLQVNLYPNPVKNRANISFTLPDDGLVSVEICDLAGKTLMEPMEKSCPSGNSNITLQSQNIEPGCYFLKFRLISKGSEVVKYVKFIKIDG